MLCPAWILDWNWNVIIMQKHFSFLLQTSLSLFFPWTFLRFKIYAREREGMYWIGVRIDQGMIEKRREREKHNEKCWTVASQQARVQTLPPALQNYFLLFNIFSFLSFFVMLLWAI